MLREVVSVHAVPVALQRRATCLLVRRIAGPSSEPLPSVVHANPYACLNFVAAGRVRSEGGALPRVFLCGPLSAPFGTVAYGGLVSCSLVFPPWLLAPLFACTAGDLADGVRDVGTMPRSPPSQLEDLLDGICAGRSCFDELWTCWDALTRPHAAPDLALEALLREGVAAASAQLGCSARHYLRRFRETMGLAPAAWARFVRWERAVGHLAKDAPDPLSDVALAAGYSDQAHLTRETRAITGAAPARLRQAVKQAKGPWSLSPARVRSVQDSVAP